MKELGDYLKRTRVSNGVSIAEAAEDLDFSTSQIENIESGNVRAFKDVYSLKNQVKQYAKYLGLDSEKVVDEFNGFLFEHTSKISLDDIRAAQKNVEEKDKEKKAKSPYTMEYKRTISIWSIVLGILAFVLFAILVYVVISDINKAPTQVKELSSDYRKEISYEFTY